MTSTQTRREAGEGIAATGRAGGGPRAFLGREWRAAADAARRFAHDRRGGAMLVTGAFVIATMCAGGAGLLNMAWHEAHLEEIRAAMRAAIASAGASLLAKAGDGGAVDAAIAERVAAFVEAATQADVESVTVSYDAGKIDIGMVAQSNVDDLWGFGGLFFGGSFDESAVVSLTTTRHEFAVALDVSQSMTLRLGTGTRMDALKAAMRTVATNLADAQRDSPAGMLVSVVPFGSAVKLADTSAVGETEEKARYLRMMGGRLHAKWVDIYHHYGVGATHEIAVPAGWTWDTNVWSGCFMARWGAYWNTLARPTPLEWPAALNDEPLHLSDAAPDVANANTLFTPYSWPDAGPAGNIDVLLQLAMAGLLAGEDEAVSSDWYGDNDWSLSDGGGDELCHDSEVLPLTDDVARLREVVADLSPEEAGPGMRSLTYTHLGVVWGLRMLSAGWQDIWKSVDFRGVKRPLPPASDVRKTVLVVSDGRNYPGAVTRGFFLPVGTRDGRVRNPNWWTSPACRWPVGAELKNAGYERVAMLDDEDFNDEFVAAEWRQGLATALGKPDLASRLGSFEPVDAFRGANAAFADTLVDVSLPRPTQVRRHLCDYTSVFGPYGRVGDPLYIGGEPQFGHSPWPALDELPGPYTGDGTIVEDLLTARLYEWWDGACAIAAAREVEVHTVFIGNHDWRSAAHIDSLRRCSQATGGEMLVTPDAATLNDALGRLVRLRRELRFVE